MKVMTVREKVHEGEVSEREGQCSWGQKKVNEVEYREKVNGVEDNKTYSEVIQILKWHKQMKKKNSAKYRNSGVVYKRGDKT